VTARPTPETTVIDDHMSLALTPAGRETSATARTLVPGPVRRATTGGLVVVVLVAVATVLNAWTWRWFVHPDTKIAQRAADVLFSADWYRTYLEVPQAQMGPLSIAASRLPHELYVVLVAGLSLPFLAFAAAGLAGRRRDHLWYAACCGLIVPWSQFAWKGHADDALVLLCAVLVIHALDRGAGAGVVLPLWGIALLAKPTAILFLPLVVTSIDALVMAGMLFALIWLPFVWDSPTGFLRAAKGIMHVSPHSLWGELGLAAGPPPTWLRPLQLGTSLALAAWATARKAPAVALLLAFTVRSMAEMNPAPSYAGSVVALALVADARSNRPPVLLTIPALVAFWTSQPALEGSSGWPRILAHLTVIALCVWCVLSDRDGVRPGRRPSTTADRDGAARVPCADGRAPELPPPGRDPRAAGGRRRRAAARARWAQAARAARRPAGPSQPRRVRGPARGRPVG
jgi:hypothetical protein